MTISWSPGMSSRSSSRTSSFGSASACPPEPGSRTGTPGAMPSTTSEGRWLDHVVELHPCGGSVPATRPHGRGRYVHAAAAGHGHGLLRQCPPGGGIELILGGRGRDGRGGRPDERLWTSIARIWSGTAATASGTSGRGEAAAIMPRSCSPSPTPSFMRPAFAASVESVPVPEGYSLVLANSMIEAKKQAGARNAFNSRVAAYIFGLMLIKKRFPQYADKLEHLRDVNPGQARRGGERDLSDRADAASFRPPGRTAPAASRSTRRRCIGSFEVTMSRRRATRSARCASTASRSAFARTWFRSVSGPAT